ncbi:MAG: 4'-phosphopantetheinyl transferase superfamily protein [Pirellulales bacterium]
MWLLSLREPPAVQREYLAMLAGDERDRADRFHHDRDREAYIAARGGLRLILSGYLQCAPGEVRFDYGSHGKPLLAPGQYHGDLQFNLAHSGDLAVCGVTEARPMGIDIERHRQLDDMAQVARHVFSPQENDVLWSLPAELREQAFFNAWTRKEAYIKGRGLGLALRLDTFDVTLAPDQPAGLLATREDPAEASRWKLCSLPMPAGYTAALAVAGDGWQARLLQYGSRADAGLSS